ncbi:ras guanine nucleotide exchange factor P-like [Xenia sp. Carnegie-2017]|uniref:ras guanine nucleotide exchange factor P-like n=1 Tax=Xenia sp. Carnegie-2017 TaxID=2897299 RepID=UPI001F035525|nr:ras guanine nucleotide exchange factor P-like [Xenia sp. Carnegie-2017]
MKIVANIPARLHIAGHWCVVKYSGQKPVCFKCHKEGHIIADCPSYRAALARYNNNNPNEDNATISSNNNTESSIPAAPLRSYAAVAGSNALSSHTSESTGPSTPLLSNNNSSAQSAPACASDAAESAPSALPALSAPSGRGGTVDMESSPSESSPTHPSSPVRRRGKRRHSPVTSPQPEEKRATPDDAAVGDADDPVTTESPPETVPLPADTDDDDDDDNEETEMDNETNTNTNEDGDDENDDNNDDNNDNDNDENDENDDIGDDTESQQSEVDQMDPADYLDLGEDEYPSDDGDSFAIVSEAELPNSPAPRPVQLSLRKDTRPENRNKSSGAVAHDADALYKLAAVLPTQGGSPSY